MQDIIQGQIERLAMQITHSEQGDYKKNEDYAKSIITEILQALIEREENRLKECEQCDNHEIHDTDSWNKAKQDTITHLRQLLDNLQ